MTSIKQELDTLKLARRSSEVKIQELQRELSENQQKASYNKKDVQHLEEKLYKVSLYDNLWNKFCSNWKHDGIKKVLWQVEVNTLCLDIIEFLNFRLTF